MTVKIVAYVQFLIPDRIAVLCTYIDAAYCYRPSSMVCQSVAVVSPAKMAEPMEMLFGLWDRELKEPCIRWGSRTPWVGAILRGKGQPTVKYRDALL